MPTLFQWNLTVRNGVPLGIGIVSGHPKLTEGTNIHTSPILFAEEMNESLVLETASGSTYHLRMAEWDVSPGKEDALSPEQLGLSPDFWTRCARCREKASISEKANLRPLIKSGALFMRIVGTHILSAFWGDTDSHIRDASIGLHLGMFQDSYLVRGKYEEALALRSVDLRFFPMRNRLEPYHISQGIKLLLIGNEGCTDIAVGFDRENVLCPPGTITPVPIQSTNM